MAHARSLSLWLCGLISLLPLICQAAGNQTVDALSQAAVVQYSGNEALSDPFAFDITVASGDRALNFTQAVGQPLTIAVAPGRVVSGMIEGVEQVDGPGPQGLYRLRLVPSLDRLKYRSTSRTFYGMTALDVVKTLLNEAGVTNFEFRVSAVMPAREMTVQYQETDLAFLSRVLEEVGVHYHVELSPNGDKVVFSDGNAGFPVSPLGKLVFGAASTPSVSSFSRGLSLHSGQVQAGDYNWKTPATDLTAEAKSALFSDLTERVFPSAAETKADAQAQANIRLAAHIAGAQQCRGESTYPQLQAGQRVVLTGHPRPDFNQEYVITAVEHYKTAKEYRNSFRCLPAQVAFRPPLITPRPVIGGMASAIVVGPAGETKHVDQFGRIKVRFPWRSPAHTTLTDPGDAGFVRVAQIAAGTGSAAMWLPEVGDEVLVAFEHGDPDRPVVIGSLYNGKDMPPVALPANKHLSLFRSQSASGAKSELVFDTTAGNERLLIQSGQNGLTLAANGITLHGPSVSISSTGDLMQRAGRALVAEAGADLSIKAGQNLSVMAQRDADFSMAGNTRLTSGGALQATAGSNAQVSVGSNLQVSVGSSALVESGKDVSLKVGQHFLLQSQRSARFTAGEDTVIQTGRSLTANAGTLFQFVAAQTGSLQAGDALLALRRDGNLDIVGKDIAVISSGHLTMKSSGNLTLKGSKITQN